MNIKEYNIGTIVEVKKQHPCGVNTWEVLRVGMDIKLKCTGCERLIMLPRRKFDKMIKKIVD
jgi:Uncharacterized protein conserved in bacteria